MRRVTPADARVLKKVRLAALLDSPSAFGSTYAAEAAQPDSYWEERAASSAAGLERAIFLAFEGEEVIGLAGGWRETAGGVGVDLVSMWTAPAARRSGVARRLVEAVVEWARDTEATAVNLWVTRGNDPAQRLYESMGFSTTGDYQPLPSDPCKDELRMEMLLNGSERLAGQ